MMMCHFIEVAMLIAIISSISFSFNKRVQRLPLRCIRKQFAAPSEDKYQQSTQFNFFGTLFSSFANIFRPMSSEMVKNNMVSDMQKFDRGSSSMSDLRKKYKAASEWDKSDIVENFAKKFIPTYGKSLKTSKLLEKMKFIPEEDDLLMSLDEYNVFLKKSDLDPITATEKFISEALMTSVSPLKDIDEDKLTKNRKFFKPVQMSRLRKVLAEDPDYFEK